MSQLSNIHKHTTTEVNSLIYVCKSNRIQKLFTTTRYMSIHTPNSTDHTGRTTLLVHSKSLLHTNEIHNIHTPLAELFTRGPSSDHTGRTSEQSRVKIPASAFHTVSPPSDALQCLLVWSLPCCWLQTAAQPITTSHIQIVRISLATPHLHWANALCIQ